MDYLFWGSQPVHIFTDHRNLLYVFAPSALRPNSPRHVLSKVHRWAIHFSRFEFFINHIDGAKNVFADILTRWSKGFGRTTAQRVAALYGDIVPSAKDITTVTTDEILREQAEHEIPAEVERSMDGLYKKGEQTRIPDESKELKLRISVEAHCGERGHRAYEATLDIIAESYWWNDLKRDVREFIQSCIHCIVSRTGERIPRPLSVALHGTRPNEVVHADFLYMGVADDCDLKYILLLKDDIGSYSWLFLCASADSEAATNAISKWIACFGCMEWLVTDQGAHFTATLMTNLTKDANMNHHFTRPYYPWANGTVERLCREVLRTARALLSEWKLPMTHWPSIIDPIQKIINQSPLSRLGRNKQGTLRCPMEVFAGLKRPPTRVRPLPFRKYRDLKSLNIARIEAISDVTMLHDASDEVHKDVATRNTIRRTRAQKVHNAKTNVSPLTISIGDYVIIRTHAKSDHKPQSIWCGPMRVVEAKSDLVFVVEDIINAKNDTVHAQRILPYPVTKQRTHASEELVQQAEHFDKNIIWWNQ